MENQGSPIIFCHYGNSYYLKYTLRAARLFNPQCRIILLGDEYNRLVAKRAGIEHYDYNHFGTSDEIRLFNKVYKHVAGKDHKREFWTNFVIKRWFFVHEFMRKEGFGSIWHFDSDNLIMTRLRDHECKFKGYDTTEQCKGICMNGFISSFQVVDRYIRKINCLFQDEHYLDEQRKDFIAHPDWAFTEMRAYIAYRGQQNLKSVRLNTILNDETFDDCIFFSQGYDIYNKPLKSRYSKKLFISKSGLFFFYNVERKRYIKVNTVNLSWVPDYLFETIFNVAKKASRIKHTQSVDHGRLSLLDIYTPSLKYKYINLIKALYRKFKLAFKQAQIRDR